MQKHKGDPSIALPVIIGLAVGTGFFVAVCYSLGNLPPLARTFERPSQFDEFTIPDQLAEVTLLKEKYQSDTFTQGFSRSENNDIEFIYLVGKGVDVDGDGYGETWRQLELTITYDESEGLLEVNPDAKLIRMQARCIEPATSIIRTNDKIIDSAEDGGIVNFIQSSKCVY